MKTCQTCTKANRWKQNACTDCIGLNKHSEQRLSLAQVVEQSFSRALAEPTIMRWKSCSIVAGCAAVRMAADGNHFVAAMLEGVAEEARRQYMSMMPRDAA